jgi:DNA-binding MarR family transcriptional regulator
MDDDVLTIQLAYPRIWHACHRRHRRGPTDEHGPSERHVAILAHLDPKRSTRAGDLARHLGIGPSTLSEALDDLERHGYVKRRRHARDRRIVEIFIREKGKKAVAKESALDGSRVQRMLARLGDAERKAAVAGLELLSRAALETQKGRAS